MTVRNLKIFAFIMTVMIVFTMMPSMADFAEAASKPAEVTGLTIIKQTGSEVTLKWNKVKNAKKYQVHCTRGSSQSKFASKKTKIKIRVSTKITCRFRVRAYNGRYGAWSLAVSTKDQSKISNAKAKVKAAQKAYNAAVKAYREKDATNFLNRNASIKTSYWDDFLSNAGGELGKAYQIKKKRMKYYFTVGSLLKAADFVTECNEFRAKDTVRRGGSKTSLTISYDLMISSAYAGMISEYTMNHTLFRAAPGVDGAYAENLAWGYIDPYDGWYREEMPYYQKYLKTGSSSGVYGHYTNMTERYTNTGFGWDSRNATAAQRFGNGSGVTPEEFKSSLGKYVAPEKAEKALNDAREELDRLSR